MARSIDTLIDQANQELKVGGIGFVIQKRGTKLCLRGTLPPRPGSLGKHPTQQRLSLGLSLTIYGIQEAKLRAKEIRVALERNQFVWEDFDPKLKQKAEQDAARSFGTIIEGAKAIYFLERGGSEYAWKNNYIKFYKTLDLNEVANEADIIQAIEAKPPNTPIRYRICTAMKLLAQVAGLSIDIRSLRGTNLGSKAIDPKAIPTDQEFLEWREHIPNPNWLLVYDLMLVFGLRPHEVFLCSLEDFQHNESEFIEVDDKTKTGKRLVYGYHTKWIKELNLKDESRQLPQIHCEANPQYGQRCWNQFCQKYKMPFPPYSLRHGYSARGIKLGIPNSFMAMMMGHTVDVHCRVYQRLLSDAHLKEIHEQYRHK